MIKENELRVGNLVLDKEGKPNTIKEIKRHPSCEKDYGFMATFLGLDNGWAYCDELMPIPLTPEILEACGFENFMNHPRTAHMEIKPYPHLILYKEPIRELKWRVGGHKETFLTSLHQLQNLYFSLTVKELEIKKLPIR